MIGAHGRGETGEIAFHVRDEDGNPGLGEPFGQDLERDGLAGPGRARDQTVPVRVFQEQPLLGGVFLAAATHENRPVQSANHAPNTP